MRIKWKEEERERARIECQEWFEHQLRVIRCLHNGCNGNVNDWRLHGIKIFLFEIYRVWVNPCQTLSLSHLHAHYKCAWQRQTGMDCLSVEYFTVSVFFLKHVCGCISAKLTMKKYISEIRTTTSEPKTTTTATTIEIRCQQKEFKTFILSVCVLFLSLSFLLFYLLSTIALSITSLTKRLTADKNRSIFSVYRITGCCLVKQHKNTYATVRSKIVCHFTASPVSLSF